MRKIFTTSCSFSVSISVCLSLSVSISLCLSLLSAPSLHLLSLFPYQHMFPSLPPNRSGICHSCLLRDIVSQVSEGRQMWQMQKIDAEVALGGFRKVFFQSREFIFLAAVRPSKGLGEQQRREVGTKTAHQKVYATERNTTHCLAENLPFSGASCFYRLCG